MRNIIWATAILQLGMIAACSPAACAAGEQAAGADGIRVGGLIVAPAIKVKQAYNDNVFRQEKSKKSSWISVIEPALSVTAEKGVSQVEIHSHLSRGVYHSSHHDDYLDYFVGTSAKFELSSRLKTGVSLDYSKTHRTRGTMFTGQALMFSSPYKYHQTVVGVNVSYGLNARIDVKGGYSNKRYDNHRIRTNFLNLETVGGSAAFSYPLGPKTRAVLEASYRHFNYLTYSTWDSNEQRYSAGVDWKATARTSGKLRLGYWKRSFMDAQLVGAAQFSWELSVLWKPTTYSSWELASDSMPMGTNGTGSYSQSSRGSLTWNYAWNAWLRHSVYVDYRENKYKGWVVPRKDKVTMAGVAMDYQFMRQLGINVAYDYLNRNSNVAYASYRDNIWSLNLVGAL